VVAAGLIAVGFFLSTRRDVGGGLRGSRPGHDGAPQWLTGPVALAWRLHRGSVRGWALGLIAGGLVYGTTAEPLTTSFADLMDSQLSQILSGGAGDLLAGYLNMMVLMMVIATAIFVLLTILKVRAEENEGRAEPVLATGVSKRNWMAGHVLITAGAAVVLLVLACAAIGVTAAAGTSDWSILVDMTVAGLAYSPAVLVIAGLVAACYGVHPRVVPLATAVVAFSALAAFFGELLELPDALMAISPWHHTRAYPAESVTAAPLVVQLVVAAALTGLGVWAFGRRDLRSV